MELATTIVVVDFCCILYFCFKLCQLAVLEVPEEEVDSRPLYDRLKEVRDRKQAEYDEEHRLSKFYN